MTSIILSIACRLCLPSLLVCLQSMFNQFEQNQYSEGFCVASKYAFWIIHQAIQWMHNTINVTTHPAFRYLFKLIIINKCLTLCAVLPDWNICFIGATHCKSFSIWCAGFENVECRLANYKLKPLLTYDIRFVGFDVVHLDSDFTLLIL